MRRHEKALDVLAKGIHVLDWDHADIVIVGNGIAGLTAALEARRLAPQKRIVIMTEQSHPTIYTPALKQFAAGKLTQDQLLASPAGTERAVQIEVINTFVEEIHSKEKSLSLSDGQCFGYDKLLLATGSKPNGLPASIPGRHFDGVLTLHRLSDYLDLSRRLRLREVHQAVVVGGGLHALETVMVLLHWGIRVSWLIRGATLLPSMLDQTASEMILEYGRRAGAKILTETEVVGIVGRIGTVVGVVTNHQQTLPCQLVALCTGTTPVTTLAEHCDAPLKQQRGIQVDDYLQTSVQDIYAAGDAAASWNPYTGEYQSRKYWYAAVGQGRVAAAAMTGSPEKAAPFGVPWHAMQLGKISLLIVGDPLQESLEVASLTNARKGSYRRLAVRDEQLVGYLSLAPTQPDSLALKRMIDEGLSICDIEQLLLTGEFDARRHFAQLRTQAAHTLVVTGKLAVPSIPLPLSPSPKMKATRDTEPLSPPPETGATFITEPLILTSFLSEQHDMQAVADPLQKRVERQSPRISSITSLMDKPVEARRWIVPALLPEGLVVLAGKQKAGKSWLGLALGLAVASGGTVLGDIAVEQGHVLYLALEESERRLQERLNQLLVLGTALHQDFEYATSWHCLDDDGLADLEAWLVSHPQARLLIVDSWAKVQPDLEQQTTEITYEAFEKLRELAYVYHVSILVHFHLAPAATDQFFNELTAMSGTSACADAILHLQRSRGNKDAVLSGTGRAYAQTLDHTLSFNDGCWELAGHAGVRTQATLSPARKAIIDVLHEEGRPMQPGEIALALGKRAGTIRKMLSELKVSNLVQATAQGYVALVPEKEAQTALSRQRNDARKARSSGDGGHNDTRKQAPNIVQFQGPLPRSKKPARTIDTRVKQSESM